MTVHDELAGLRQLLAALESGKMTLKHDGEDVTRRELAKLKPDIAYLETVVARTRQDNRGAGDVE